MKHPPSGQAELNEWIVAKLFVVDRLASSLLSLWVSAVQSDQEVSARVSAIRESTQAGIARLPDGIRSRAAELLTEMLDQAERDIKEHRAALSAAPQGIQ